MRGGALYYALFLSLLILVVLSVVIAAVMYQQRDLSVLMNNQRLNENIESAVNYALSSRSELFDGEKFDLFGDGKDQASIKCNRWGGYGLYLVSAYKNNRSHSRMYLVGSDPGSEFGKLAVVRSGRGLLNLSGSTSLRGGLNIPVTQLKEHFFEGKSPDVKLQTYFAEVDAERFSLLPEFMEESDLYLNQSGQNFRFSRFSDFPGQTEFSRSFFEETLVLYESGDLFLKDFSFSGNIIIISASSIFIEKSTFLKDVRLYAGNVVVGNGFDGVAQLYGTKAVKVGENCFLKYPSIVGVFNRDEVNDTKLFVGKGSRVYGTLFLNNERTGRKDVQDAGVIEIEGSIKGLVISDSFVELKGEIDGLVVCNDFIFRNKSGVFKSHLVNAKINGEGINEQLLSPLIFSHIEKTNVIDWVN